MAEKMTARVIIGSGRRPRIETAAATCLSSSSAREERGGGGVNKRMWRSGVAAM